MCPVLVSLWRSLPVFKAPNAAVTSCRKRCTKEEGGVAQHQLECWSKMNADFWTKLDFVGSERKPRPPTPPTTETETDTSASHHCSPPSHHGALNLNVIVSASSLSLPATGSLLKHFHEEGRLLRHFSFMARGS